MKADICKCGNKWTVKISQGNQAFLLDYKGSKKEAKWFKKMVDFAIESYKKEILTARNKDIYLCPLFRDDHLRPQEGD